MAEDFYQRLGVPRTASDDEIKKAYRKLAKKYHPDVNPGDKKAEDKFKDLSSAFEVLSDPKKKKLYDEFGDDAAKIGFDEKKAEALRAYRSGGTRGTGRGGFGGGGGVPFEGFGVDFGGGVPGGFEDIFAEIFGQARRRGGASAPGPGFRTSSVVQATATLTLAEAVRGCERTLEIDGKRTTIRIPPGVDSGTRIQVQAQGVKADVMLDLQVFEHPIVRREGLDLYCDLPVTVRESMLGAEIKVPTFHGGGTVKLKAGTQSGTKLRLRGQGVPSLEGAGKGDLYLVVQVRVPEEPDERAKKAAEELDRGYGKDVRLGLVL
jgi:DnaJ-class molecular chaperone